MKYLKYFESDISEDITIELCNKSKEWRRTGINTKMNNKVIEFAKESGCSSITVNVRESNISSLNSLLKSGFTINDNVDLRYPDGEKKIALYLKLFI